MQKADTTAQPYFAAAVAACPPGGSEMSSHTEAADDWADDERRRRSVSRARIPLVERVWDGVDAVTKRVTLTAADRCRDAMTRSITRDARETE